MITNINNNYIKTIYNFDFNKTTRSLFKKQIMKLTSCVFAISLLISLSMSSQISNYKDSTFNSLDKAYASPNQVYKLRLINQHLNVDTLDLSIFINLQKLTLASDSLLSLPKGLEKLTKLIVLDISANNFTLLPEQLSLISNLEELYLNNEKHLDLAQSFRVINKITHLKRLHLDSIPNFKLPKHLKLNNNIEYLSMRYNGLTTIPDQVKKFVNLKTLDLEGNNIKSIKRNFLKNKEIESLVLSISPQFEFKKSFLILSKEPRLNSLTISNSKLDVFNQDFSILNNLTSLSLRNDHLTTFPTSILGLKKLKNLDLGGNDFKSLPSNFLALNKLETLDLTGDDFLNFNQTADLIRYLPSLRLVHVHNYDYTFNTESYLIFKNNTRYVELFPGNKKSSVVHMFKELKHASKPALNIPLNNFNAEGFGIRLGF